MHASVCTSVALGLFYMNESILAAFALLPTYVQEVEKRNPGAIAEIREMKYLKEAAQ